MIGRMPWISQLKNHQRYIEKLSKNWKNEKFNRKKNEFSKKIKSLYFLMVKGPINPKITSLGEEM